MATITSLTSQQLEEKIKNNQVEIIDVREKSEYDIVHVKNSKLVPLSELPTRVNEIDWSKDVIFICRSGSRSQMAANFAISSGRNIFNVRGGIEQLYTDGKVDLLEISPDGVGGYF